MRSSVATTLAVLLQRSSAFSLTNKTAPFQRQLAMGRILKMDRFVLHRLDSVESTQDEARSLLRETEKCLAVIAKEQTKGRGTSGRQWVGLRGNVFLTIALPMQEIPVTITLLPLKVGTLVASSVQKQVTDCNVKVSVKWPNDVLVDQRKISGVLIESFTTKTTSWLLVGIGINVVEAPGIPTKGPNRGRPSTSIQDVCNDSPEQVADLMAVEIASGLVDWVFEKEVSKEVASSKVVKEWKEWAEFGHEQTLRDTPENEVVVPLGIELDGQLRVRGQDGQERLLVADYLL